MFGSDVLDVAIGIVFVFLLVSLLASAVREGIEAWLKTRATHLEKGIRELLHDPTGTGLARQFFEHPLIYSLYSGEYKPRDIKRAWATNGANLPSYIPSRNFALALIDLAARGPATGANASAASAPITLNGLRATVSRLQSPRVERALLTAIDTAQGDLQKAQANIEAWYDSAMDRVSGWYKRSTQWIIFFIGLTLAIALNVNTMAIVAHLYTNKASREVLVARAQSAVSDPNYATKGYNDVKTEINNLPLPIGWSSLQKPKRVMEGVEIAGGWLLTAIAASLGAPFWFDLLNKLMVIRSTVKPHEKSPEEASEDRQISPPSPNALVQAAAAGAGGQSVPGAVGTSQALDPAEQIDGCDVSVIQVTKDEDLPPAQGGVS